MEANRPEISLEESESSSTRCAGAEPARPLEMTGSFQDIYEHFPYPDLLEVRDQLLKDIYAFERTRRQLLEDPVYDEDGEDGVPSEGVSRKEVSRSLWDHYIEISEADSPYAEYALNLLHLSEISLLILKAFPEELGE